MQNLLFTDNLGLPNTTQYGFEQSLDCLSDASGVAQMKISTTKTETTYLSRLLKRSALRSTLKQSENSSRPTSGSHSQVITDEIANWIIGYSHWKSKHSDVSAPPISSTKMGTFHQIKITQFQISPCSYSE